MDSIARAQTFVCPMSDPPEPTVPLQIQQHGLTTWWRCPLCQAREDDDWHVYVSPEMRRAAKRLYDGSTTEQFRIFRPIVVDYDAIMIRQLRTAEIEVLA